MNRIDRIAAILIQLQSKPVVKAREIAERFDISLRTVYRDIRALEEAGVPLAGEAGMGYFLVDGYRLPPVMFSKEEAQSFLAAERLIEQMTDSGMQKQFKSAMFKIRAVLKSSEKADISNLEPQVRRKPISALPIAKASDYMRPVLNAISEKKMVLMHYHAHSTNTKEDREIEPVGIYLLGSRWHLVAFCHKRNDYRNFRLDRIQSLKVLDKPFSREHPSLNEWLDQKEEKWREVGKTEIIIRFDKSIYQYFGDQKHYMGYVSEKDLGETIEMRFECMAMEGFARWFMMFGDKAEIIKPESLKARVLELCHMVREGVLSKSSFEKV